MAAQQQDAHLQELAIRLAQQRQQVPSGSDRQLACSGAQHGTTAAVAARNPTVAPPTEPGEPEVVPRWCKKCKVVFAGQVCPGGHANFVWTKAIPAAAAAESREAEG